MAPMTRIEAITGDIANQPDLDAVVNAANAELMPGGGVAGALHRAAGPELAEACRPHAPIAPGEVVVTEAFGLPNHWVIHCLGPRYGIDDPPDRLLHDCYRKTLEHAEAYRMASVGFPALSTGAFGYPFGDAAAVAVDAIESTLARLEVPPEVIRFVFFSVRDQEQFEAVRHRVGSH